MFDLVEPQRVVVCLLTIINIMMITMITNSITSINITIIITTTRLD